MNHKSSNAKFAALEVGRGLAASAVVLHHAGNILAEPRFFGEHPFFGHLQNFNVGVDFFFVLSGFIISWVHWRDIGDGSRLGGYAVKRFLRIYPPYWGIMAPLAGLYLLFPAAGIASQHDSLNIFLSIFLLPGTAQPVLGVAWTLVHEVFFYALFAVVIAIGRAGLAIFPFWALAIVAFNGLGGGEFPFSFLASPFNLEFIMGVGAAALLRTHRVPLPRLFAIAGAMSFLALMLFAVNIQDNPLTGRLAFGGSAFIGLLGFVEMERRRSVRLPPVLALLGAASYSIYLVHPVALSFAVHVVKPLIGDALPLDVTALLLAGAGIAAGLAFYRFAEPILLRAAKHAVARLGGQSARVGAKQA